MSRLRRARAICLGRPGRQKRVARTRSRSAPQITLARRDRWRWARREAAQHVADRGAVVNSAGGARAQQVTELGRELDQLARAEAELAQRASARRRRVRRTRVATRSTRSSRARSTSRHERQLDLRVQSARPYPAVVWCPRARGTRSAAARRAAALRGKLRAGPCRSRSRHALRGYRAIAASAMPWTSPTAPRMAMTESGSASLRA
jgi:hypothetical protein